MLMSDAYFSCVNAQTKLTDTDAKLPAKHSDVMGLKLKLARLSKTQLGNSGC